jgi:Tfp pilus assembly ATPase PilU
MPNVRVYSQLMARRIVVNIAKLPELEEATDLITMVLRKPICSRRRLVHWIGSTGSANSTANIVEMLRTRSLWRRNAVHNMHTTDSFAPERVVQRKP